MSNLVMAHVKPSDGSCQTHEVVGRPLLDGLLIGLSNGIREGSGLQKVVDLVVEAHIRVIH